MGLTIIDAVIYELYFPDAINTDGCAIMQHLTNLPELTEGNNTGNLEIIENVYRELSDPAHPVSIAMEKMKDVEEVRIIEGLDEAGSR